VFCEPDADVTNIVFFKNTKGQLKFLGK